MLYCLVHIIFHFCFLCYFYVISSSLSSSFYFFFHFIRWGKTFTSLNKVYGSNRIWTYNDTISHRKNPNTLWLQYFCFLHIQHSCWFFFCFYLNAKPSSLYGEFRNYFEQQFNMNKVICTKVKSVYGNAFVWKNRAHTKTISRFKWIILEISLAINIYGLYKHIARNWENN